MADESFYRRCLELQTYTLKQHNIDYLENELPMLCVIAESFKTIDDHITPLEKLECV